MAIIIVPRRREDFFDDSGEPTLRFVRWMEEVTGSNNENSDSLEQLGFITSFSAQLQQVRKELNGLSEFTIDTTGFTTDLTFITTDKVIA